MESGIQYIAPVDVKNRLQEHGVTMYELPVGHFKSLPMPTKRWGGVAAYALFASPSVRLKGEPVRQSPPDRWLLVGAHDGRLVLYALANLCPFSEEAKNWSTVDIPEPACTLQEQRQTLKDLHSLLASVVPAFFRGEHCDLRLRRTVHEALVGFIPPPLVPQYMALVPDFFEWLAE